MNNRNKDVVDYLNEKRQLIEKLNELKAKSSLLTTEQVVISEIEGRIYEVNLLIEKLS